MNIPEPLKRIPPAAWVVGIAVVVLLVLVKGKGGSAAPSGVSGSAGGGGGGGGDFSPDLNQEVTNLAAQIPKPEVIAGLRQIGDLEGQIIGAQNQRASLLSNRATYQVQLNTLNDKLRAAKTTAARNSIKKQIKAVNAKQAANTAQLGKVNAVIAALTKTLTDLQKSMNAPVSNAA